MMRSTGYHSWLWWATALVLTALSGAAQRASGQTTERTFALSEVFGARQVVQFRLAQPGKILLEASWAEHTQLALILNGPDRNKGAYARRDGYSPLTLEYEATPQDLSAGDEWKASIVNFSRTGPATGSLDVTTPATAPITQTSPGTTAKPAAPFDIPTIPRLVQITARNAGQLELKVLARIQGNAYQLDSTADSHTASVLAVGVDRGVILLDTETGREVARCPAPYSSYAISGSGRVVAGAVGGEVQLCDPLSPTAVRTLQPVAAGRVTCLAFSSNGRFLAAGGSDGKVRVWDITRNELVWTSPAGDNPVVKVALSSEGGNLAAAYTNSSLTYWDLGVNASRKALPRPGTGNTREYDIRSLSFLAAGRKVVFGLKGDTWLWDVASKAAPVRRLAHAADAVSPAEQIAVSVGEYVGLGTQGYTPLTLWDISSGAEIASVKTARGMLVVSATFTKDGSALLASTNGGEILVWRPPTGSGPTSKPTTANSRFIIHTTQGDVAVLDFRKHPALVTPDGSQIFLEQTPDFQFSFDKDDSSFGIGLTSKPLTVARRKAESALLRDLGISKGDACKLAMWLGVPVSIDSNAAGRNFGLSFCPSGIPLPGSVGTKSHMTAPGQTLSLQTNQGMVLVKNFHKNAEGENQGTVLMRMDAADRYHYDIGYNKLSSQFYVTVDAYSLEVAIKYRKAA